MSKISAEKFAEAGFKYIGRSYEEMDCQKFVEKCMADCGLRMDLGGSNSWYREVMKRGWVGTPEECRKTFGKIPKGALLFILEAVSASTPAQFRDDGIGDATHIGIKTGTGKGAIHSSYSRGGVCESEFNDKTIPNGGWNRVGLYQKFTYGDNVDRILDGGSVDPDSGQDLDPAEDPGDDPVYSIWAQVISPNGGAVNTRKGPDETYAQSKAGRVSVGTVVRIVGEKINKQGEQWYHIEYTDPRGATWYCWMKGDFLQIDAGEPVPADPEIPDDQGDGSSGQDSQEEKVRVILSLTKDEARLLLKVADNLGWQLEQLIGGLS